MTIRYERQEDGTFKKSGEVGAVAEVQIKIGGQPPFGKDFTLAQATEIIETAIAKGQVKHDVYSIIAVPEKPLSGAAAKNAAKAIAAADALVLEPGEVERVNAIQAEQSVDRVKAIKVLRKEQKTAAKVAAKAAAKAAKPPKAPKPVKELTPEETARVTVIQTEQKVDLVAATKLLRKEQSTARLAAARAAKAASKPPKAPKAPKPAGTPKRGSLDSAKIAALYAEGKSVGAIAKELGASYMGIRLQLIKANLLKKEVVQPAQA